jgi:hypothetical protein
MGEKQNVRVGDDNFKTSPITLTHKYATAGNFNATVKGNTMVRGLKTAQACAALSTSPNKYRRYRSYSAS